MSAPKLSLFTPTHDPRHLYEAYDSLKLQDYENWEWVIVPNGQGARSVEHIGLRDLAKRDPRVRVIPDTTYSDKIGALKRFACDNCKGDAFVEFDHDDLLVPGILSAVAKAIDKGAGFVYSDSAVFETANDDTLKTWGYSPNWGWEQYPVNVYGKQFIATRCFPLSPRMLCEVYFAPDHIRVWSREAYYKAGGHDPLQSVGDDHDLMCRTYLTGTEFAHTGTCGYLYRLHASNTIKQRSAAIAQQVATNRREHLDKLVTEWCRRENHPRLDLLKASKTDWDPKLPNVLNLPVGVHNNHYGQIMASDVLQYVPPNRQVDFFNAMYDVLLPGGYLHIAVPSVNGLWADMNPLHLTRFNRNSFLYYAYREMAQNMPGVKCRFDLIECSEFYPGKDHEEAQLFKHYNMLALRADLAALKGQKHPGPDRI